MHRSLLIVLVSVLALGGMLTGCPKSPQLAVSTNTLHFGVVEGTVPGTYDYETELTFQVWNSGCKGTTLVFTVSTDEPWITAVPDLNQSTGENDKVTVTVTIDRAYSDTAKALDFAMAHVTVEAGVGTEVITATTAPEYFTQAFSSGIDVAGLALTYTPNGGPSFYEATKTAITEFPTDPSGGLVLSFDDFGDPIKAGLFGDDTVPFYGLNYDTLYIGSEGWVSFGEAGSAPTTLGAHFATPQISALPVDATLAGSMVSYLQDADKLVITYENAPSAGAPLTSNDFQVELFFDGTIRLSYLNVDPAITGVLGLSAGVGQGGLAPEDFVPSDLTNVNTAPLKAAL